MTKRSFLSSSYFSKLVSFRSSVLIPQTFTNNERLKMLVWHPSSSIRAKNLLCQAEALPTPKWPLHPMLAKWSEVWWPVGTPFRSEGLRCRRNGLLWRPAALLCQSQDVLWRSKDLSATDTSTSARWPPVRSRTGHYRVWGTMQSLGTHGMVKWAHARCEGIIVRRLMPTHSTPERACLGGAMAALAYRRTQRTLHKKRLPFPGVWPGKEGSVEWIYPWLCLVSLMEIRSIRRWHLL